MQSKSALLQSRLTAFGVDVGIWALRLRSNRVEANIAAQLTRSSMSPAANYSEARQAESRRDFLHKMQVCLKELSETDVWLSAAVRVGRSDPELLRLRHECNELIAIFVASIKTTKSAL